MRRLGFVLLLSLLFASIAQAQVPGPQIQLEIEDVGYGNVVVNGQWAPITVTLTNNGADVTGSLEFVMVNDNLNQEFALSQPVEMPGGGVKQVTLLARITNTNASQSRLVFRYGNTESQARVNPRATARPEERLAGVVATAPEVANPLLVTRRVWPGTYEFPDTASLPASDALLQNFQVLALGVANADLTPEQVAALERWVALGGWLIIDSGPVQGSPAPALASLLPGSVAGPASTVVANSAPIQAVPLQAAADASVVAADDTGTPLAVWRAQGLGGVLMLGYDPATSQLLTPRQATTTFLAQSQPTIFAPSIMPIVQRQGDKGLPPASLLLGLLLLYIFLIGPVNFFVLRKLERRELAWVTIPASVLIFTLGAYVASRDLRDPIVQPYQLNLFETAAGADADTARVTGAYGFVSGSRDTQSIALPPQTLVGMASYDWWFGSTFPNIRAVQASDGTTTIPELTANIGDLAEFAFSTQAPLPYAIDATLLSNTTMVVTNTGSVATPTGLAVFGEYAMNMPPLQPGESVEIIENAGMDFPYGLPFDSDYADVLRHFQSMKDRNAAAPGNPDSQPAVILIDREQRVPITVSDGDSAESLNFYYFYLREGGR